MSDLKDRVLQIRRAHASAKPKDSNPAWQNAHHDLGVALQYIDELEEMQEKLLYIIACAYQVAGLHDAPERILDVLADPESATQEQVDAMLPYQRDFAELRAIRGKYALLLEDALNTILWLKRRIREGYGDVPTVNRIIKKLQMEAGRLKAEEIDERVIQSEMSDEEIWQFAAANGYVDCFSDYRDDDILRKRIIRFARDCFGLCRGDASENGRGDK